MKTNRRPRRLAFETCDSTPCTQCSSRAIVPPIRNQRSGIRNSGNSFISRFFTVFTFVSPCIHDFHAKKISARIPTSFLCYSFHINTNQHKSAPSRTHTFQHLTHQPSTTCQIRTQKTHKIISTITLPAHPQQKHIGLQKNTCLRTLLALIACLPYVGRSEIVREERLCRSRCPRSRQTLCRRSLHARRGSGHRAGHPAQLPRSDS